MSNKTVILIIDDEAPIRRLIKTGLDDEQHEVIESEAGKEGLRMIATSNPAIVILDLGLPDIDGVRCIKELREWSTVPLIVLSARGEEKMKVEALDAGANDYITKPFSMTELQARIRVALRSTRSTSSQAPLNFEAHKIQINFTNREVLRAGKPIHLTPLEYKLLTFLAQNAGRVLTHKQILSHVWGAAYSRQNHYVRILMKALRHKLEQDPTRPKFLTTESGVGYRLKG